MTERIAILVPTRGRPDRALDMAQSVYSTMSGEAEQDVEVIFGVDADDPLAVRYLEGIGSEVWLIAQCGGFVGDLNTMAKVALTRGATILGAFGDDVLFRTHDWDARLAQTLATPGIAYGDDLIHGINHPSAVFMSAPIVKALGWIALPSLRHQWADDAWKLLGQRLGALRFMDGVVFEHMHPAVGKAEWDDGYRSVLGGSDESNAQAKHDFEEFTDWSTHWIDGDVAVVRHALEAAA